MRLETRKPKIRASSKSVPRELCTGDNDGRVDPMHSRKMTARLQAATTSGFPILLRTSSTAGHGIGTGRSERVSQAADVFAFLFDQLKVDAKAFDAAATSLVRRRAL